MNLTGVRSQAIAKSDSLELRRRLDLGKGPMPMGSDEGENSSLGRMYSETSARGHNLCLTLTEGRGHPISIGSY